MCDDQHASPSCGSRFELDSDDSHVCGIQAACRLVEDKDVAIGEKRAGNCQTLALATRANAGLLRRPSPETGERSVRRAPNAAGNERAGRAGSATGFANEKKVPYETVFSLLQTGERVLKNEEPVIAVDRGQGKGEGGL